MRIGPYTLRNNLFLAPMAGVTDRPFRILCRRFGAGMAVSEMVSCNSALRGNRKTLRRVSHDGEPGPVSVQIFGADPPTMAAAAKFHRDQGAQIIDINMGCPAKKICRVAAGSALLRDELLVARILEAVVAAVDLPVTLKMRTGWDPQYRNGVRIARIAEQSGIQALAVHGRTRACGYAGRAEYDTIRRIKQAVAIPVIANGDIATPQQARAVLASTGADGIMIGRAARGRPWIFRHLGRYLTNGEILPEPLPFGIGETLLGHVQEIYRFYGEHQGVRMARKHIAWYSREHAGAAEFRRQINQAETTTQQLALIRGFFDQPNAKGEMAA